MKLNILRRPWLSLVLDNKHTSRERKNIYNVNQFINHHIPLWRAMQSKMWFFWKCINGDNDLSFRRATAAVSCISTWQWGSSLEGGRIKVILTTSQYPCSETKKCKCYQFSDRFWISNSGFRISRIANSSFQTWVLFCFQIGTLQANILKKRQATHHRIELVANYYMGHWPRVSMSKRV